ncbi:beta-lactamase-like protein [Mycena filopes]|nr:beta-lactamase-like protein [Mycena filopes]
MSRAFKALKRLPNMASARPPRSQPSRSPFDVQLTFLGTASAQPSATRIHSSLALRLGADIWLFDCGEGTQSRLQRSILKMGKIEKIFITHTHGDHIFGLIPLLASILNGSGGAADADDPRERIDIANPVIEIYGPLGTRAYVRSCLKYTHTLFSSPFVVHELRLPRDPPTGDYTQLPRHHAESPSDNAISVSAGPILHSVPCVGYVTPRNTSLIVKRTNTPMSVMKELQQGQSVELSDGTVLQGPQRRPGRKIVILGDTHNPSGIEPLALDADLLIHEATNAHLPGIDEATKIDDTGHSTPQMAGAFAKRIRAKQLILNHFSARYAGNDDVDAEAKVVMDAIAGLATGEYGKQVLCARDLMTVTVVVPPET